MLNSTYKPVKVSDFEASKLNFNGIGVSATCAPNAVTNIDYKLLDDCLITGGRVIIVGGKFGDKIDLAIVDTDNIMGYGAGFVLNKFVSGWLVANGDSTFPVEVPYPAKVYGNLYLRVVYTSINTASSSFAINYNLHKVLV
jgi:hypothetical protein